MEDDKTSHSVSVWRLAACCLVCAVVGTYLVSTLIWVVALLAESTAATQARFWRKALLTLPLRTLLHTTASMLVASLLTPAIFGPTLGWLLQGWRQRFAFGTMFGGLCWLLRVLANRVLGGQWFLRSSTFDLICLLVFGMFAAGVIGLFMRRAQ